MSPEEIQIQLDENTKMTREVHHALIGMPEYKVSGLVDDFKDVKSKVERHDLIITKYGGGFAAVVFLFEIAKFYFDYIKH